MEGWLGVESRGTSCSADPLLQKRCSAPSSLPRSAPAPSRVRVTAFPSPRGCWRTAGSSHGLDGCRPFVLDAAQPCLSLPGALLHLIVRGNPGPTAGAARLTG